MIKKIRNLLTRPYRATHYLTNQDGHFSPRPKNMSDTDKFEAHCKTADELNRIVSLSDSMVKNMQAANEQDVDLEVGRGVRVSDFPVGDYRTEGHLFALGLDDNFILEASFKGPKESFKLKRRRFLSSEEYPTLPDHKYRTWTTDHFKIQFDDGRRVEFMNKDKVVDVSINGRKPIWDRSDW